MTGCFLIPFREGDTGGASIPLKSRRDGIEDDGVFLNPPPRGGHRGCFLLWSESVSASTLDNNKITLDFYKVFRMQGCMQSGRRGIITLLKCSQDTATGTKFELSPARATYNREKK